MLGIDQTDWQIMGTTLMKRYRYSGLVGEESLHRIQIDIEKTTSSFGHTQYHVFFFINPSPWPQLPDGFLVAWVDGRLSNGGNAADP